MADEGQDPKRTPPVRPTEQPHAEGGMSPSRYSGGEFASPPARSGSSETGDVPRGTFEPVEEAERSRSLENSPTPLESTSSPVENCSNYGNKSAESVTPDTRLCDTGLNIDLSNAYPVENKQELLEKFGVIKNPTGVAMLRTKKQRKYVEGVVAGKSRRRAAIEAGYSEKQADSMGRIRGPANNPNVQEAFKQIVQKVAPIDRLAARVSQGLD